jgi:hypothetical protein
MGGNGPGNGERPIIAVIEGEEHGPIATQLAEAGVLAEHEGQEAFDPHQTIAQRNEEAIGADTDLQSVRTSTYVAQPMPIEVPLRGRTQAKASVGAVAETAGIIDTVHVTKGQNVKVGDLLCTLDQGTRAAAVEQAEAGLAQAQASLEQAQADLATNEELREKGLAASNTGRATQVAVSAAEAQITTAQAAVDNAKAELERTEIRAKVAGVVQDPLAVAGAIGLVTGVSGFEPIKPVFDGAFKGVLCLFLLDMGLVAARNLLHNRTMTPVLAGLAIGFAVVNGSVGVLVGTMIGLDGGSSAALGILAGSASYIAAPAAIRLALPQVDIGLPLTMSLAVTFPFNILVGIPLFAALAKYVA